jgi:DNA ligase-associated metallophosphoesterase
MMQFVLQGEELQLLPQKAIYWPARKILFIADTHFGKIAHFRKAGLSVPHAAALENLLRFENLLNKNPAKRVFFLGDLFHSDLNTEWLNFKASIRKLKHIQFELITGNHDVLHPHSYQNLNFKVHAQTYQIGPFYLSHEPLKEVPTGVYNLCGHIHPGVRLLGQGRQSMRLPCFYFGAQQGILPAFGEFTGIYQLKPKKEDTVFVVSGQEVLQVN